MQKSIKTILRRFQRLKSKQLENKISIEKLELSIENKLAYILRLLSVRASVKTNRKSLPFSKEISMRWKGPLIDKMICQWENEFYRKVAREVLNDGIYKFRFYIEVELLNEKQNVFREGELSISMHYYIHK